MKYYLLRDDMWLDESADRWIFDRLKYETDKGNLEFVDPPLEYMEPCTYPIDLHRAGRETDFSFTMDSGNIPILSKKAKSALDGLPKSMNLITTQFQNQLRSKTNRQIKIIL